MSRGHVLALHLRRAYLSLHRRADAHFSAFGVTADQFVVLTLLAEREGVTQQHLARRTFSDPNTIRAILVLLEKRRLLVREVHPNDGRARCVFLTAKGRLLQKQLWDSAQPMQQELWEILSPHEQRVILECLSRIGETMAPPKRQRQKTLS